MNFLSSLANVALSASSAALSAAQGGGIPSLPGYQLGDKVPSFDGRSIWTLYDGIKKDDGTTVSIFAFDASQTPSPSSYSVPDRRSLTPMARNALRKLRTLRHPNVLKFLDGSETDSAVWIITEHVRSLATALSSPQGVSEESKMYGLLHLATALSFLNKDGASIHGNVRPEAIWLTQSGEWKLGGVELCTRKDEDGGVLWQSAGFMPDARSWAAPEVRKSGYTILKENDASALDAYQLHLLLFVLFNGPLPHTFGSSSDSPPALPSARGSIPQAIFQVWRRLGNPNPRPRLKTDVFLELGMGSESAGGGWWPANRLVKLSAALDGFSLASESERAGIIRTLKEVESQKGKGSLPEEFLRYKVLPSLVRAFEFGGGGPALLPLILSLAAALPEKEYAASITQPLVRMFATPDRAMRMALLEGLDKFADKLTNKDVVERIWPHLLTGFGDIVPVIREATVKSILLIAPKLTDRILNNDLLRHLAKTQTDPEPGIRTNTCILLGRLSRHLQPGTNRKVLVPAFARALRDPFVPARIAGLMALMATADCYEKEDLAGKVIPAMSICLIDRERSVRDQGFKAMDMFVKKCETLTASMPDTVTPEAGPSSAAVAAISQTQPGLATSATGAAGALAGWAFASVSKKLSAADLEVPLDRRLSEHPPATPHSNGANGASVSRAEAHDLAHTAGSVASSSQSSLILPGSFGGDEEEAEDWGGDLMDVNDDEGDWNNFESGQPPPRIDPLAARLSATRPKTSLPRRGGALKLGGATKSSSLRVPMDMDAGDNWDIDDEAAPPTKPKPIIRAASKSVVPRAPLIKSSARPVAPSSPTKPAAQPKPPTSLIPAPLAEPLLPPNLPLSHVVVEAAKPNSGLPLPSAPSSASMVSSPAPPPQRTATPPSSHASLPSPITSPKNARPPSMPVSPLRTATPPVSVAPTSVPSREGTPVSATPNASRSSTPALEGNPEEKIVLTKEEKAVKLAAAREERRARMARLKK